MKNKIFICLAIVILVGVIIVASMGFNVDMVYREYKMIEVNIGQDFNISDLNSIAKDVLKTSNIDIEKAGEYKDIAIIKASDINESQKTELCNKINEKYGTEIKSEDTNVSFIPALKLTDLVKPYILPVVISTVLIMLYMVIRFSKLGIGKVLVQIITLLGISELLYFALIAITRYPVNRLTLPVACIIYMAIFTVIAKNFEKQLEESHK